MAQARRPFSCHGRVPVGVLVVHGLTGAPGSVAPLSRRLADAGLSVEAPCLSGHGTRWEDMRSLRVEDWLEDLQLALIRLRARSSMLFAAGLSMGGTLALRLAQVEPDIRGVMVVNHAILPSHPLVPLAFLLKRLLPSTPGIASDLKDPGLREAAYGRTPTAGVAELHRLTRMVRRDLPRMAQPLLIFKSREDHVLPPENATWTLARAGSRDKELVWLDNSYHVATLDHDKDRIAAHCLSFIQRLSGIPLGGR